MVSFLNRVVAFRYGCLNAIIHIWFGSAFTNTKHVGYS
jgi:hypothetical protein